jgi:DMSO/TMAO reductase YedYZ molybdopterin-dependent catalytic subunit
VALAELARRAGARPSARFVRFTDPQGYDTTVPLARALAEGLLAYGHDGQPLAREHGGPLRAVVPSLYAWKSCKWVVRVEFLPRESLGFWELRGYHNSADPWKEERLV